MGGIAEFERELIRKRCQAGIDRANRKGTKFGRPTVLDASQTKRIAGRYAAGKTMAELAHEYDCSEPTVGRTLQGPCKSANPAACSGACNACATPPHGAARGYPEVIPPCASAERQ